MPNSSRSHSVQPSFTWILLPVSQFRFHTFSPIADSDGRRTTVGWAPSEKSRETELGITSCCHLWSLNCPLGSSVLIPKHRVSQVLKTLQLAGVTAVTRCHSGCHTPTHHYIPWHTKVLTNCELNCFKNDGL